MTTPLHNPYSRAAEDVLATHRSWMPSSGQQRAQAMQNLLIALGSSELTTPNAPIPLDTGAAALMALCQFLKVHGGTLHALTQAHNELHQP